MVAPLDWGLGHASRCIPLIHYLLSIHWEVVLAGEGSSAELLKQEFPNLRLIPLQGYRITYPKNGKWLILHLITQIPKIIRIIRYEKEWLTNLLRKEEFDFIISDNRYGLNSKDCYSILITHQLQIISGMGKSIDALLQKMLYPLIHRFNLCWIPDSGSESNLAGLLSHPYILPKNVKYIGPLSRLKAVDATQQKGILVLLSGLEPQRTQLEEKLLEQLSQLDLPVTFVRGIPVEGTRDEGRGTRDKGQGTRDKGQGEGEKGIGNRETSNPTTHNPKPKTQNPQLNFMTSAELEKALPNCSIVICRSGYSSIMDLLKVQKKAILIPTPGQTEQEYLAKRLSEMGVFVSQDQENLNLSQALADCQSSNPAFISLNFEEFKKAFQELGIS
ncbi:MAG: hypothetical protein RL131_223 [Bacteroidota bacterium]